MCQRLSNFMASSVTSLKLNSIKNYSLSSNSSKYYIFHELLFTSPIPPPQPLPHHHHDEDLECGDGRGGFEMLYGCICNLQYHKRPEVMPYYFISVHTFYHFSECFRRVIQLNNFQWILLFQNVILFFIIEYHNLM